MVNVCSLTRLVNPLLMNSYVATGEKPNGTSAATMSAPIFWLYSRKPYISFLFFPT